MNLLDFNDASTTYARRLVLTCLDLSLIHI